MKALIALLLVLLIFGGCWLVTEWLGNEVTVHQMFCTAGRVQGECKSKEETANPTTYKVFVDQQTVVYWVWNSKHLSRFTFCAVRDVQNWSCKFERADEIPTREYQMIDSEYNQTAEPPRIMSDIFYPVSRWHWWRVWLLEKLQ